MQKPSAVALEAWSALLVAHRRLTTILDRELRQETGMTLDEYDVLYQLRLAGRPMRMTELANQAVISRPTTSRVVDRLVARGWLDRWHDDHDRRAVLVELSREGRRQQARAAHVHLDGIARLVEGPVAGHDLVRLAAALVTLARGGDRDPS